jgi:hypothetical protein
MRRRSVQVAFLLARLVFSAGMKEALHERTRREAEGVFVPGTCAAGPPERWSARLGQYVIVAWLYSVWAISSELAWIVLGRDPWWSERRLSIAHRGPRR